MAQNNERNPHTLLIPIGALSAGQTKTVVGPKMLRNAVILGAALMDSVAIPASSSDYVSAKLRDHTADLDLASGDTKLGLSAYEGVNLALSGTAADALAVDGQTIADKNDSLVAVVVSPGSAALTAAALAVSFYYL